MFGLGNVFAETESTELFPLPDIVVGMSAKELFDKYPYETAMPPALDFGDRTVDRILNGGGDLDYEIHSNKFWDVLGVRIDGNAKVKFVTYNYMGTKMWNRFFDAPKDEEFIFDYDISVKNIKPLFKQLKQQLGVKFDKKIIFLDAETRCAMYVWKREKDVVAFSHSPVSQYKKGDGFFFQLALAENSESLAGLYHRMTTNSVPEDVALWADAMGEQAINGTQGKANLWIYIGILLCLLCPILYFLRRKLKTRN